MYTQLTKNKPIFTFFFLLLTLFIPLNSLCYADVVADGAQATSSAAQNISGTPYQFIFQTVQFFLFAFFIYYMLVLRPQQLNEEDHARFIKALKKDDDVQTQGGMIGKVVALAEDFITVEVASGVRVKVLKSHIKAHKQKEAATKNKK